VPWIGASLAEGREDDDDYDCASRSSRATTILSRYSLWSLVSIDTMGNSNVEEDEASGDEFVAAPTHADSPLNDAITALNRVLTVHLNQLVSDLHRSMYHAFVKMCATYVRWKRFCAPEREELMKPQGNELESMEQRKREFKRSSTQRSSMASLVGLDRKASQEGLSKTEGKKATRRPTIARGSTVTFIDTTRRSLVRGKGEDEEKGTSPTSSQSGKGHSSIKSQENSDSAQERPSITKEKVDMNLMD